MTINEHNELMCYLEELMRLAMKIRYSYEWFMQSAYMKLVNDTLVELLIIDVSEGGI